jgi:plasmid stabilization system protein ParE
VDKKVIWTNEVYEDIESTAEYISKDSPFYASAFVEEVLLAGKSLNQFPERGRQVPEMNDDNIREIFVKKYRLIYKIKKNQIIILALIHGARDLAALWEKNQRDKKY